MRSDSQAEAGDVAGMLLPQDLDLGVLPESIDDRHTSAVAGIAVGTNFQRGPWVGGVEAGISFLDHDGVAEFSADGPLDFPPLPPTTVRTDTSYRTEIDNLASVRWRGGFATGSNLFFVSAGVAGGEVRNEFGFAVPDFPGGPYQAPDAVEDEFRWGYVLGLGFERLVTERVSIRAEVVHFDLEDVTVTGEDPGTPGFEREAVEYEFRNRGTVAMLGVSFSF